MIFGKVKVYWWCRSIRVGSSSWINDDQESLPSIVYPDIVNYLVFSPSPYTAEDHTRKLVKSRCYQQFTYLTRNELNKFRCCPDFCLVDPGLVSLTTAASFPLITFGIVLPDL